MTTPAIAPLLGLVLAGGRSSRMGRDKAALQYHGRNQLDWACERLAPYVDQVFVSVRADQADDPVRAGRPQIADLQADIGPIAGIAAAQAAHPDTAWLVLACDLPFLDDATLKLLTTKRDPARSATAFRSAHDGLPEPLCAIYEPRSQTGILAAVRSGKNCPRKFLIGADTLLLDAPVAAALDNINSSTEYLEAMNKLATDRKPLALTVQYYALLREQAGGSEEKLQSTAASAGALYDELRARHPFTLAPEMLRVAINGEFADWQQSLQDGDVVVFIPPVAGG